MPRFIHNLNQINIQKYNNNHKLYWTNLVEQYSDPKKEIAVLEVEKCKFKLLLYALQALPNLEVIKWSYSAKKLNFPDGMPC